MIAPRRLICALLARLTYANVVATIALFAALGTGGAFAATQLGKNSVGAKQLRKNAVTGGKVRNGSLGVGDLSKKGRQKLRGAAGPVGPQGPAGAAGPQGPAGVTERAVVSNTGGNVSGTAQATTSVGSGASNTYRVTMRRDVSACAFTASLSLVPIPGINVPQPPAGGTATVEAEGGPNILVRTWDAAGAPVPSGFHLIVAC